MSSASDRSLAALVAVFKVSHRRHEPRPLIITLGALAVLPLLLPYTSLAGAILIMGLFAAGYNIVFGFAGILSLGHAALFGGGAYATGLSMVWYGVPWPVAILVGGLSGTLLGVIVAFFGLRTRGIYFAMITLAFGQSVHQVAMTYSGVTGGDDGLRGFAAGPIRLGPLLLDPAQPLERYYIMFGIVAVVLLMLAHILASPFGTTLRMMRENEERAQACGVNVRLARMVAFALSGAVCGLAGGLYALHLSTVPIDTLSYRLSGQVVMMTLLGGMGTFVGPFVGAGVFLAAEHLVADITTYWQMVVGGLFIALVLYCPRGIWGTAIQGARR